MEILDLLEHNTALRKLSAVQKRHLESLAEGPVYFAPGQRLWRSGTAVEKAYIIVGGTVSFVAKRRNAGSAGVGFTSRDHCVSVFNLLFIISFFFFLQNQLFSFDRFFVDSEYRQESNE